MPSKKPTPTTPLNSNVVQKQQAMHHNQTILQQAQQPQQQFFQTNLVQNNNTYLSAPVMQSKFYVFVFYLIFVKLLSC